VADPLRILLVEDEALIALSLGDALEAEGHAVALAFDGVEGLDRARGLGEGLDVLVTDLNMPGLPGEDLIRAVRAGRPGLPVVVVTGSAPAGGAEALRRHAGGHGPLLLLHKPLDGDALAEAVRRAHRAEAARTEAAPIGRVPAYQT
jgi:CheY-like chemotaxis protein